MGPVAVIGDAAAAASISARSAGYRPVAFVPTDRLSSIPLNAGLSVTAYDRNAPGTLLGLLTDQVPPSTPVLITGPMENHGHVLRAMASTWPLLGPTPDAIEAARRPGALMDLPATHGLRLPKTLQGAGLLKRLFQLAVGPLGKKTLIKPIASYGGEGIGRWSPLTRVGREHYLQQYVRGGTPISGVYSADGWSAQLLGVTEQLVGEPVLGASEFAWCGAIGPVELSDKARDAMTHLGVVLTQRFDLRGVFGVDVIVDWLGRVWPVEVNPRYPHSAPIVERALGHSVLTGRMPASQPKPSRRLLGRLLGGRPERRQFGMAVCRAGRDGVVGAMDAEGVRVAVPEESAVEKGDWLAELSCDADTRDACIDVLMAAGRSCRPRLGGGDAG